MRHAIPFALLLATLAVAQQPNGAGAGLLVNGAIGPPFPIGVDVRTATLATFSFNGSPGMPFILAASGTGLVAPGTLPTAGGICDLPLAPAPFILLDGADPAFALGGTGQLTFAVGIPPHPVMPVGHQEALQAVVVDPTSPAGYSFTAATQITFTLGPTVIDLSLGDDGAIPIGLSSHGFTLPFFGSAYGLAWVCVNGFVTLGAPDTDFTATDSDFNVGPPRLAPFWSDLDQVPGATVRCTIDPAPPGGQPPFVLVEWIGVPDWGNGLLHTHSVRIDADGSCVIQYPSNTAQSAFSTICGIGPGGGLNYPMKDLGALVGSGLTGAPFESFYEWFGHAGMWGYPGPTRLFDLYGTTLHFAPAGAGALPGSTTQYVAY